MTAKLPEFNARVLAQLTEDAIWSTLPEKFMLVFDDGAFVTQRRETILSWYSWWPYRERPDTPMLAKYHIGNNHLTDKTILALNELTSWGMYDFYPGEVDPEYLALRIKQELNRFYNSMTYRLEEYVVSISALDFVEIMRLPAIRAITDHLQGLDMDDPGISANMEYELDKAYKEAEEIIMTHDFSEGGNKAGNRLVEAVRAKIVDILQVLQCVIARGKPTDVDDTVFPKAIVRGMGHGLEEFHDVFIESSSAKKALSLAKTPLAKVEYFNRQQQLSSETLSVLDDVEGFYHLHGISTENRRHIKDCGSTGYVHWKVTKNNLSDIHGLYHFLDDGTQELISPMSVHLIGQLIRLRTALTCSHPDQYSICAACFGELSLNIPYGTNIAHASSVELCARVSQKVLSTKHYDASAILDRLRITASDARYIKALPNQYEITLSGNLDKSKAKLRVTHECLWGLSDIHKVENMHDLVPSRVTTMSDVLFEVENEFGGVDYVGVPVSLGSRLSSFSVPFLRYLKEHGYEQTAQGDLIVDLSAVPHDLPIWTLPRKHASMLEFMKTIEKLIKASDVNKSKGRMDLTDYNNLSASLVDFYDLVSQKFSFSVTHLAVMLRATMVRSKKDDDYRLPIDHQNIEFAPFTSIMKMRSLSANAAFEKLPEMYMSPLSYLIRNRAAHPLDEIIIPTPGAY